MQRVLASNFKLKKEIILNMRLNILALSHLFPNNTQPNYGIFVLNRLRAVGNFCNIKVIAPIKRYPFIDSFIRKQPSEISISRREQVDEIDIYHPIFFVVPRYLKWSDALSYLWAVRPIVKILQCKESFNFDLIDVHWTYPDIVAGYFLAKKYNKKFIVTVRGRNALYPGNKLLRQQILTRLLCKADFVITLSDELKCLVLEMGVAPTRVRTILNGVDTSCFFFQHSEISRKHLGIKTQKKTIVSVGSLIEGKGHHELVRVMPKLLQNEKVELYIIGRVVPETGFNQVLQNMITDLKVSNIHLVGEVDHNALADWYRAANLFCLITKAEGCPNVLMEALACGTPVVATNVGAIRELVIDGKNGFVIENDQIDSLEQTIRKALNWNWDRVQIAERMSTSGWLTCAEQVLEVYQSVLGQH